MVQKKLKITLYFGEPLYVDASLPVNQILRECAANRHISRDSMKGFLLIQNGYYFIPDEKTLSSESTEPIYYRYVDYHTNRDCLYYVDNPCFQYVYHQYKHDARNAAFSVEPAILTELCAIEILVVAMVFGDPHLQKPHKFIKHYKELTDNPIIDMETKEVKATLTKALKNLKDIRTEYECMEHYIRTVDKNIKEAPGSNRATHFKIHIDMMKKVGISAAQLSLSREKIEIVEECDKSKHTDDDIIHPTMKQQRPDLHSIVFSDPKLYIKAFRKDLNIDILTQYGRYGIMLDGNKGKTPSKDSSQYLDWQNCVALLFFYASLEYPRSRREPCQVEVIEEDGRACCLLKDCPLIVPAPPIHYKLTRQDARMILKKYGTQDGWYMFNTFDMAPKRDENRTTGEISFSYCMDEKINQMTVNFSQEMGFGPLIYRIDYFKGRKFCSLFEVASHFSLDGRRLHTFITQAMVKAVSVPENILFPVDCIQKIKSIDNLVRGSFYSPFDNKKHTVRLHTLPKNFWFRNSNARVSELESVVKSLICDTNAIHENLLRLFGICMDHQAVNVSQITEDFGTCLHDYLKVSGEMPGYQDLLNMAHQVASGIQALHSKGIIHGFPVLHNCLIDPHTKRVKVGGVGLLRIGIATQRLDGERLKNEQPSFRCETVSIEPRYHPARWLPRESLFDNHFNEQTDRWCFGVVLWQIFNCGALPLSHLSDAQIVDQLNEEKDSWYKIHLEVLHENRALQTMLTNTINYCLTLSCTDSIHKVVRLIDCNVRESTAAPFCYTFATLNQPDHANLEDIDLKIEEIDGELWFISPEDCDCEMSRSKAPASIYKPIKVVNSNGYNAISPTVECEETEELTSPNILLEQDNPNVVDVTDMIDTIDGSGITLTDVIVGQGHSASVRKGILRNTSNQEGSGTEVAVKIYHPEIKAADIQKEIDAMQQLKHDCIIPLKGICRSDGSVWLIMNFYKFGSLDKYIEQNTDIPVERLSLFASQIAEGMLFLSSQNYIHRDLSTRNVLVQDQNKVRISDLGLSRSVEKNYYKHTTTRAIPYLWYPPEFFVTQSYGKSLDVWSYGVTCHEIFNNAEAPYLNCEPPIKDIEMLKDFLNAGKRLTIPSRTPDTFRTIITNCWKEKSLRWTFNDICSYIRESP